MAWELFGDTNGLGGRAIEISKSTNQAQSFAASPVTVATVGCAGDCAEWPWDQFRGVAKFGQRRLVPSQETADEHVDRQ